MEIKQLEYVLMAADMGSFNKASEFLYTTQSNVSKVISSLENELGYKIFQRQGNGVILTDAGKALYDQSQQIIDILNNLRELKSLENRQCFHLATVSSKMIANCFAEFIKNRSEHELCLEVWEGSTSKVIDLVERGEASLGLIYIGKQQKESFHTMLLKKNMEFQELLPAQAVLCLNSNHQLSKEQIITKDQLKELHFVKYRDDKLARMHHLRQVIKDLELEAQMREAIEVDSGSVLTCILSKTDYVHISFSSFSKLAQSNSDIIEVPLEYDKEGFYLGYVKRKSTQLTKTATEFLDILVS